MSRTILIDADILAYRASAGTQRSYEWEPGVKSITADFDEARDEAERQVDALIEKLNPDNVIVCLSDDFSSFRKDRVDPTYKSVRTTVERPEQLYAIKDWLRSTYDTEERTALEADDVLGILATDPSRADERIIVSADKDLMTIPGLLYRPQEQRGDKPVIRRITPEAADRYHLYQTLIGDATDGYPGAPGIGPHAAEDILNGLLWVQRERTLKSGPRKGQVLTEWVKTAGLQGPSTPWQRVVAAYAKVGKTEKDALTQARLARILRHDEYDGRSPILWLPGN